MKSASYTLKIILSLLLIGTCIVKLRVNLPVHDAERIVSTRANASTHTHIESIEMPSARTAVAPVLDVYADTQDGREYEENLLPETPPGQVRQTLPPQSPEIPINPLIRELQEEFNRDIIGWLSISGADIDYPVLRSQDNEYYLRRDMHGNSARAGSLFTDYRCAPEFTGFNTIIYGHNMKNRSMFGNLQLYKSAAFLEENRHGILQTGGQAFRLEIFAFMVTSADDRHVYANPESAEALQGYIKDNARLYREPERADKILTLSTCSYEYDNARIVVFAALYPEHAVDTRIA